MSNAARTANRVVAVTKGESENTTDVEYKGKLDSTQAAVTSGESEGVWSSHATAITLLMIELEDISTTKCGGSLGNEIFTCRSVLLTLLLLFVVGTFQSVH